MAIIVKIRRCSSKMWLISRYLVRYMIKIILRKKIAILRNTEMIELILCFTTSVSLLAFILGYFKLANRPIQAVKRIVIIPIDIVNRILVTLGVNFIKKINSEIIMNGNSMV